jgi:hypothetical protein
MERSKRTFIAQHFHHIRTGKSMEILIKPTIRQVPFDRQPRPSFNHKRDQT